MQESNEINSLNFLQRIFLTLACLFLIAIVFLFRGGFSSQPQLDQLARNSLEPNEAISNGRPTLIEFYADWCEVCNKMAPEMIDLEKKYKNDIDIVLLNIDNTIWDEFINEYHVNGIPHFDFFNKKGDFQTALIGFQEKEEMARSFDLLLIDKLFNQVKNFNEAETKNSITKLNISNKNISPRSHG